MRTAGTSARTVEMRSYIRRKAAVMFRCEVCGLVFDRPFVKEYSEPRPDCFRERFKEVLCPGCGQPYFNEEEKSEDE